MLLCILLIGILCALPGVSASFGQPLSHGIDDLFDVMGQATLQEWDIQDGTVVMNIMTEKVIEEDEIWVLDFQAYDGPDGTAVDISDPPQLQPTRTGSCSNIFDSPADFYKDSYNPVPPGSKDLYNSFSKGTPSGGRRFDNYTYTGDVDTLLECENSADEKVWVHNVYEDYIEFNATLYMTNVRPKYYGKPIVASYIESYAVLYWRLLRIALSRFLISSAERLRPIFRYAVVSTVYVNEDPDQVDRSRAEVLLNFQTVTNNDEWISVYQYGSLAYTSPNFKNSLSDIRVIPSRGCADEVGVQNASTDANVQLTASTELSPATSGILLGSSHWAPASDDPEPWIQVTLATTQFIAGVITQGSESIGSYVSLYEVRDSVDGTTWTSLGDFDGNYDSATRVTNYFDTPIHTRYIRILPMEALNDIIALRFELIGCTDDGVREAEHMDLEYSPVCDLAEYPGECTQEWEFRLILNVDEGSVSNDRPIDATGNFQFRYETYMCTDVENPTQNSCELLEIPDAIISHEITLQSTVQLTDAEEDKPWLIVKKVYTDDPAVNLVGGYRPGVSHLDNVTIEIAFYPEFLRRRLELDLTLFMVCIGKDYVTDPDGCLAAPDEERYTAFVHDDFTYTMTQVGDSPVTTLSKDNIVESSQTLSSHSYVTAEEIYKIEFVNKALSALTRDYTITTIFQLVERGSGRKRRDIALSRDRRDLESQTKVPQLSSTHILDRGCPATAVHDPVNLGCVCVGGLVYSNEDFACVPEVVVVLPPDRNPSTTTPPAQDEHTPAADNNSKDGHNSAPVPKPSTALWLLIVIYSVLKMC